MKIVIGGQIDKNEILKIVNGLKKEEDEVVVKSDLDATMLIQSGEADIYVGACNTGGGGALAMAISILGMTKCATLSMPGSMMSEEEIKNEVQSEKVAFGFVGQDKDKILPILFKYLQ